jgi:hypothetical protein
LERNRKKILRAGRFSPASQLNDRVGYLFFRERYEKRCAPSNGTVVKLDVEAVAVGVSPFAANANPVVVAALNCQAVPIAAWHKAKSPFLPERDAPSKSGNWGRPSGEPNF